MPEYVSVTNLLLGAILVVLLFATFKGWGWA
jgi:hypothetical protein